MEQLLPSTCNQARHSILTAGSERVTNLVSEQYYTKKFLGKYSLCYLRENMATTTPNSLYRSTFSLTSLVLGAGAIGALPFFSNWTNNWICSGAAIESLLLFFGPPLQADVPSWVFALGLNAIYAVASTSWLLRISFASTCWLLIIATSIAQYAAISRFTRGRLRRLLHQVHFHQDKVAFFDFPVLIIDSEMSGFVAVHGVTVSLLTLSVEFHSIDLSMYTIRTLCYTSLSESNTPRFEHRPRPRDSRSHGLCGGQTVSFNQDWRDLCRSQMS